MKIKFTKDGMSIDGGEVDTRFRMSTETGQYAGCFIKSNPEEVSNLIDLIKPVLNNQFGNNYWGKHTNLVWEGSSYNVAYCDGVWFRGCSYSDRHSSPTSTTFPISEDKVVRFTIKALADEPFILLEEVNVPKEMIKFRGHDGNWINDWQ